MNRRHLALIVLLGATISMGASKGCSCHWSTAKITDAVMSAGVDKTVHPTNKTNVFKPNQGKIYCIVYLKHCPKGTNVSVKWKFLGGPAGGPKAGDIDSTKKGNVHGSGRLAFSLTKAPGKSWPVGKYAVEISLNGKKDRTVSFEVKP
ncbi:MAG: hypothetical protein J7M25_01210 [Deltaproteobacteria bacterium]|nr:hypothetical protein [Deltaproteobacteria bacterium]